MAIQQNENKVERKEKIKRLRDKLSSLTEQDRQVLAARGLIATVEGHILSLHNTILLYLQSNGTSPTIVGGYQQWKRAGKQVKRGEHGYMIWFPVGAKDKDTGDIISAETFYTATVFDISQTESIEKEDAG